ncbi:stonustoxin subunit alpha-like [Sparus aurata]|uniref:stonustoxin subunit alpha-like n=1 Tax=Sparus aurata TaxID=8175 RepID=UPI0011C0ECF0|nr:stonustoxin subunit alpha-like [Sparus aurata]XP_030255452.1 stonustoxin subunit alpha-like [Sparus aurata]
MASEKKASPFAGRSFTPGNVNQVKKEELLSFFVDITLDPDTANNHLTLSEGNKKATYGAWQKYLPNPERFDTYPQVMAKDGLNGIHYWEVDWSDTPDESVYVGVAYGSIDRKGSASEFGTNTVSWVIGQYADPSWSETKLRVWHDGLVSDCSLPSGGCKSVGVFLDWPSGTLCFFSFSETQMIAFYRFQTKFTEPVFPCFSAGKSGNYVSLRPAS